MTSPMFPLGTVMFPHAGLPLRIFEPRYRQMMRDCLDGDATFGVVLIERGSEVGGGDQRSDIGCRVSIAQAEEAPDGQWAVLVVGEERIRVDRWVGDDPYPRAEVTAIPEPEWDGDADEALATADRAVRRSLALLAELDEPAAPFHIALSGNPAVAAWQLAAIAPLGPHDRQRLLVIDGPAPRLRLLAQQADEECEMLALRLSGG